MNPPDVNPAAHQSARPHAHAPVTRAEHAESLLARMIEHQTARIPSEVFLAGSFAIMGVSLALEVARRPRLGRFLGLWATPLLVMGVYNKLVKIAGPG